MHSWTVDSAEEPPPFSQPPHQAAGVYGVHETSGTTGYSAQKSRFFRYISCMQVCRRAPTYMLTPNGSTCPQVGGHIHTLCEAERLRIFCVRATVGETTRRGLPAKEFPTSGPAEDSRSLSTRRRDRRSRMCKTPLTARRAQKFSRKHPPRACMSVSWYVSRLMCTRDCVTARTVQCTYTMKQQRMTAEEKQ